MSPSAILGSNTSSFSINELVVLHSSAVLFTSSICPGKLFPNPAAVCGLHFFNPVVVMQQVKVIRTTDTSDGTYNAAQKFATVCMWILPYAPPRVSSHLLGKKTVTCSETLGFIVNRLLVNPGQISTGAAVQAPALLAELGTEWLWP